jgi:hypothetical protein
MANLFIDVEENWHVCPLLGKNPVQILRVLYISCGPI